QASHERRVVLLHRIAEVDRAAARRHGPIAEILARAETAASAGEQHDPDRLVRAHLANRVAQLLVHLHVEAVQLVGPVQRDSRGPTLVREENGFVTHCLLPVASADFFATIVSTSYCATTFWS